MTLACVVFALDNAAQPPEKQDLFRRCERGPTVLTRAERADLLDAGTRDGIGPVCDFESDSWSHPYRYRCTRAEVEISSAGADGTWGTSDDLVDSCLRHKPPGATSAPR